MAPKPNRKKVIENQKNEQASSLLERKSWPGWSEIDSDPALFNVMLRELGSTGIKIVDIVSLDEETLSTLPQPTHALIFLFEYQGTDTSQVESSCPQEVWFANQIPDFSCASVAMLNIVNNIPDLKLGPHLQSFRDFTAEMTPMDRGYAIDNFEFLRTIHNSFARELDMQNANLHLKQKHTKVNAKVKANARLAAQKAREEQQAQDASANGARRSTRKRKMQDMTETDDEEDKIEDADAGFHFIAYIPINGQVWSLDGMDRFPKLIGPVEGGGKWLDTAKQSILDRIAGYENEALSFSLMAAVKDPYVSAEHEMQSMTEVSGDGIMIVQTKTSAELRMSQELELRRKDTNKATLLRHDYRGFFTAWVEALKENDVLEPLAISVKPEK